MYLQKKIQEINVLDNGDEMETTESITPTSVEKLRSQALRCQDQLSAIKIKLDFQQTQLSSKVCLLYIIVNLCVYMFVCMKCAYVCIYSKLSFL